MKHKKKPKPIVQFMTPQEAMEVADDMDLPNGAALAMAAEMCGMDYDDFIAALGEDQE